MRHRDVCRQFVFCQLILSSVLFAGCGSGSGPWKLDAEIARESLETTLKAWKSGEPTSSLEQKTPKIIVADVDWRAGAKLLEFKVRDDESNEGSNLRKSVELTLQTEPGKPFKVDAIYLVSTRPIITVFRQETE